MFKKYLPLFICRFQFFDSFFFIFFILVFIGSNTFAQSAQPACPSVSVTPSIVSICNGCTTLSATVQGTVATTSYAVSSIPYVPFSYNTGTPILVNIDDKWSNAITIPFCFQFYGNTYTQLLIGSNEIVTFDLTNAGGNCPYGLSGTPLPTATLPMNSIMAPYQDIDPTNQGAIYWQVVGTAPCRTFIISFFHIPYYGDANSIVTTYCTSPMFATSQIVFYETTNIIDIYIQDKPDCVGWNGGYGVEGIQNANGSLATVVAGRNNTVWTATNDAHRFTPAGLSQYTLTWYDPSNTAIGNATTLNVCPTTTTTYKATVLNNTCNGPIIVSATAMVKVGIQSVNISSTTTHCTGNTGTATANGNGGIAPYLYSWSPGGQTTQTATGLSAGTYSVTVTDSSGCSATNNVIISVSPPATFSFSSITNVACFGNNTGSASINVSSGTPPYTYSWNPSAQTTSTATGLSAGTYTITVTDSFSCLHVDSITITSPLPLSHTLSPVTNVTCFGLNNGSAKVNVSGGTLPYSYSWNSTPVQTSQTATGLSPGTYKIVVTDAHNCSFLDSITITTPLPLTHSFTGIINIDCFGNPIGSATINVSGGTLPYSYSWNSIPVQITPTASTLYAGVFKITVSDSNGCSFLDSVKITTPTGLGVFAPAIINVDCFGNSTGSATITPFGGTPGYNYLWKPSSQTTATATGLAAGIDTVKITDSNGCIIKTLVPITQPTLLASDTSQVNILCFGDSTGTATVNVAGGTPPYSYLWNNGKTTVSISNLLAGSYSVMITDAHGCKDSSTVIITQLTKLSDTTSQINILCFGDSTGSATVLVAGGTPPYTYFWNPAAVTTATSNGLPAGMDTVLIIDFNGCRLKSSFLLTQPSAPLSATSSFHSVLCNSDSTGSATIAAIGGTPSYSYLWSNGQTTFSISNLPAGNYQAMVTDTNGCKDSSTVIVTEPTPIIPAISSDTSICYGTSATENASATGGTPGYSYLWMPGGTTTSTITVSPITNTTYTVQISDSNGCPSSQLNTTITILPLPVVNISVSPSSLVFFPETICFTGDIVNTTNWQWNFGDNSAASGNSACHDFPQMGTYCVSLLETNNLGCSDSAKKCVSEVGAIIPNVFSPNDDGVNDVFFISLVKDGLTFYRCEIFDRWGLKIWELDLPMQVWEGYTISGSPVSAGTYFYVLSVSWGNDLLIRKAGFLTLVR